eukprot:CAMPEP_0198265164 /NCGR_PEP_ID=MMETSP1447-20131203/20596_1 /TAXON_ID=420782 /ORGANISM="Chaetoceros dichaeta, Strain CCMP1751" /LENGTH=33 /DNA_ID= /DNA_START= /DNA_END= /DNA_ORIENTATION=
MIPSNHDTGQTCLKKKMTNAMTDARLLESSHIS